MPSPQEIVEQARVFKDTFEQRWSLPWHGDTTTGSVWRHRLVYLLAELPSPLFDEVMTLLLEDPSFALRGIALHLIRMRGARQFLDATCLALSDPSINVRAVAVAALGQFGGDRPLEALLEIKDGDHAEVRKAAVEAFKRMRDTRSIPLLSRWAGRVGEHEPLRKAACEALGAIGDEAAIPLLQRVIVDDSVADDVRGEAARSLGLIGGAEALRHLEAGLSSARAWVRAHSAEGLGLMGATSMVDRLKAMMDPPEPWMVRTFAIEAVARLGGPDVFDSLMRHAKDPEIRIRGSVCVGLGFVGTPDAQRALKTFLADGDWGIRIQALEQLSRASGRDFGFRVEDHKDTLNLKAVEAAVKAASDYEP